VAVPPAAVVVEQILRLQVRRRSAQGRELINRAKAAFGAIAWGHGMDAAAAVAVFGVETDCGRMSGRYPTLATTTYQQPLKWRRTGLSLPISRELRLWRLRS